MQRELPRRLARRLLDLQLLPHIVVTNPHVTRVYHAYYHAFETLRQLPPVSVAVMTCVLHLIYAAAVAPAGDTPGRNVSGS